MSEIGWVPFWYSTLIDGTLWVGSSFFEWIRFCLFGLVWSGQNGGCSAFLWFLRLSCLDGKGHT